VSKIVYVTGCLGFIGVHLTRRCLQQGWRVIGVDRIGYASNVAWLKEFQAHPAFKFIHKDINQLDRLYDCDYVINTAAETHVDNSIVNSDEFVRSNVNGVHHLLKLITAKNQFRMPTLLHFSTDEVYGDIAVGQHQETDMLKPSNPYAATKAAADMLILAWARTYQVPYVILRPTNNYGIGQYVEKLIPKSIKYLSIGRKIDVHDQGLPYRTWLHVSDTAEAVITVVNSGTTNEIYNISGNAELRNCEVIQQIVSKVHGQEAGDNWNQYITNVVRSGQDVRYSIDDSKLRALGWQCRANFAQELATIVDYYQDNFVW
jgi:dTDP-glucose 4,6-dehydratase